MQGEPNPLEHLVNGVHRSPASLRQLADGIFVVIVTVEQLAMMLGEGVETVFQEAFTFIEFRGMLLLVLKQ